MKTNDFKGMTLDKIKKRYEITEGGMTFCWIEDHYHKDVGDDLDWLIERIEQLEELLGKLIDDEPCRLDHHGYCQTHRLEENCSVARARELIGGKG